jgi:hypothetical protein
MSTEPKRISAYATAIRRVKIRDDVVEYVKQKNIELLRLSIKDADAVFGRYRLYIDDELVMKYIMSMDPTKDFLFLDSLAKFYSRYIVLPENILDIIYKKMAHATIAEMLRKVV